MADAGFIGKAVHGVGLDFFRQAFHGDGLDLRHQLGGVLVGDPQQPAAGFLVLEQHQIRAHQREIADLFHFKAVYHVADVRQGVGFPGQRFRQTPGAGQRQRERQQFFHDEPPS